MISMAVNHACEAVVTSCGYVAGGRNAPEPRQPFIDSSVQPDLKIPCRRNDLMGTKRSLFAKANVSQQADHKVTAQIEEKLPDVGQRSESDFSFRSLVDSTHFDLSMQILPGLVRWL